MLIEIVVIGGLGGRAVSGDQGTCVDDQLHEFGEVLLLPLVAVGTDNGGGEAKGTTFRVEIEGGGYNIRFPRSRL